MSVDTVHFFWFLASKRFLCLLYARVCMLYQWGLDGFSYDIQIVGSYLRGFGSLLQD